MGMGGMVDIKEEEIILEEVDGENEGVVNL